MGKCFCDKLGRVEQEQKTIGFHLPSTITTNSTTGLLNLSYAYDNLGNIIRESDLSDKPLSPMPVENLHYVYEPSRPHVLKSLSDSVTANTIAYTTDPNGNMDVNNNPLTGVNRTFVYDINNMPTAIIDNGQVVANMEYDGNGARVRKYSPSGSETVYVNSLYECDQSGACTSYIFAGGTRIARKEGGTIFYIHQDHQGSTRVVTNAAGTNVEDIEYSPYGQITKDTQAGPYAEGYKFTSQLHDTETGLHYYNARYYDPYIGRFISADTIVPDPGNPQSFNRYAYVMNNPINYTDPTGHFRIDISAFSVHVGYDSENGKWNYGGGIGNGVGVNFSSGNFSIGTDMSTRYHYGYDEASGKNYQEFGASGSYEFISAGVSGRKYTGEDWYWGAGVGVGAVGVGVGVNYASHGEWSVGGSIGSVGFNYSLSGNGTSVSVDPTSAILAYLDNRAESINRIANENIQENSKLTLNFLAGGVIGVASGYGIASETGKQHGFKQGVIDFTMGSLGLSAIKNFNAAYKAYKEYKRFQKIYSPALRTPFHSYDAIIDIKLASIKTGIGYSLTRYRNN